MLENSHAYSGIGVDDVEAARRFYGEILGQRVETLEEEDGLLQMHLAGERPTLIYRSPGIVHGPGPDIAWFKDPSGNVLSVHSRNP